MLSIVIPAHNEERRIGATVRALRREFPNDELIVIADACSDETTRIVSELAAADANLRVIDLAANIGKGGSVRLGFQMASGDVVAFVDADASTSPAELRRLVSHLDGVDCVVASRWSRGARIEVRQSPLRRLCGRGFNFIVRLLFGLRLADTQCGAKVFRRVAIEEILEDVETADFAFDVDLLYQLQRRGKKILEVPTVWRDREGSKVNVVVAAPKMFASIVRLRLLHSPCRYVVPIFDALFRIRAIKCRRLIRILVISKSAPGALDPASFEGRFHELLRAYRNDKRNVEWWTAGGARSAALGYVGRHRNRFDCVVEMCSNGDRFWTPFYSFKPKLVVSPDVLPENAAGLDCAIMNVLTRRNAYFIQEGDGSWTYHPRIATSRSKLAARRTQTTIPAGIQ